MKRNVIFVASVVLLTGFPLAAFAISYLPGQTLDPSCPPSDPTCIVVPNTTSSSFTATSTTATSTFAGDVYVAGTASSTNVVVSGSLTLGSLNGILKAVAGVITSALVNLATDVTGILGIGNGGTGVSTTPTYGQLLVGNGGGGYALTSTSSLGIAGTWGSITGSLASQTDLRNALSALLPLASWYATTTSALAEGTNLYWTNSRFDARLAATTSLPNITTLGNLASVGTIASGIWHGSPISKNYGGTGIGSYSPGDILYADNSGNLQRLPIGSTGNTLQVQAGLPAWGTAPSGSGGGAGGVWATTTNNLAIYPANTAYQVIVGGSATSTLNSIFEVHGGAYVSGNIGIATTSPVTSLSVAGSGYLTGGLGVGVLNTTAGTVQTSGNALFGGTVTGSSFSGAGTGLTGTAASLSIGGNANTATTLQSARTINNVSFDGSGNITITAASSTALSDNNTWSGTNAFGTISAGVWHGNAIGATWGGTGSSTPSGILVGNGTGAINSLAFSGPLSLSGSTLALSQANGSQPGFLASADWTNFNGKLASSSLSAGTGIGYNSATGVITNSGVTSLAASYPLLTSGSSGSIMISLGFGTTTSNTWSSLQTLAGGFLSQASSTIIGPFTVTGATTLSGLTVSSAPSGFLQTNASGVVSATSTFSLANNVFGILGIGYGGTGVVSAPTYGQLLVGNGGGGYALTSTSSLGIAGTWGSITGTLSNQTDLQNALNLKLSSSSLATSALLAGLVSDHTGSGSLAFATSPTFAGTPVFGGGIVNYSTNSTTTIPNGNPYAWTVATSTTATPLVEVDTSGSNGAVSLGAANASSSSLILGATGAPATLVFAASSTIEGAGTGQLITIGANADTVDFMGSGNVGIGTTTPGSLFSVNGVGNWTAATSTFYSTGGINLSGGCFSINGTCIGGSGGGVALGNPNTWTALQTLGAGFIAQASSTVVGPLTITGALTLGSGTTTTSNGININGGCFSLNGTCINGGGGPTYTFSYPLTNTSNTISLAFGTTTANTWSSLQTFSTGASTTNLVISGLGNTGTNCLQINALGVVSSTGSACGGSGSTPGGSSGQIQFNSASTFGGASNLWWDSTNNRLGIGTASPNAELSVATPPGASGSVTTLFAIASSTNGTATTTLFSIDNMGNTIDTLAASSTFAVGANGLTNPAFQILASSTNTKTGLQIVSEASGGGVYLNAISPTSDSLYINPAGTNGNIYLQQSGSNKITIGSQVTVFSQSTRSTASNPSFQFNAPFDSSLTANTEANIFVVNLATTQSHSNGVIPLQRDFLIIPAPHSFSSYSTSNTIGTLATFAIAGAPQLGINGTSTNAFSELIGTSTGSAMLNASTTNSYGLGVFANAGAKNNYAAVFLGGNVGIGSTSPQATLEIWGPDTGTTSAFTVSNTASTTNFTVYDTGNAMLAGSLVQNSDIRLKTNIQSLDGSSSLAAIDALNPITFNWIDPAKSSIPQFGFIAQQVQSIFPNLISTTTPTALTPDGTLSLNYIDLISPIVSAIHALSAEIASIESTIAGFAESITTHQLNADKLCLDGTCITQAQLAALLASERAAPSNIGSSSSNTGNFASSKPDTLPVIAINGDNPAIIDVGATYTDLGATIAGPQADLNLGIATFVNGAPMNPVQIDTTQTATDTIDYVVTDASGNTSTSTRTVIIQAPASQPPTDSTASTTQDAATSTVASQ